MNCACAESEVMGSATPPCFSSLKGNWWLVRPWRISSQPERELLFSPILYSRFTARIRIRTYSDTERSAPAEELTTGLRDSPMSCPSETHNWALAPYYKIGLGEGRDSEPVDAETLPSSFPTGDRMDGKSDTARSHPGRRAS